MDLSRISFVAEAAGFVLDDEGLGKLDRYGHWLTTEAVRAGGIGPNEPGLIEDRHILDSLAFATGFMEIPRRLLDIGTGVGLPGIVLAILWPESEVTLLDRAGRRIDLVRRAKRVLELENARPIQADVFGYGEQHEGVVMRAVLPVPRALPVFARCLTPGGTGVLALRREAPADPDEHLRHLDAAGLRGQVRKVEVLDPPTWMLIMTRR